jgi:P2 phage tail completion protein R (GpR)
MFFLASLSDYLVASLHLDATRVFAWVEDGEINFQSGQDNSAFSVEYTASLALSDFSGKIDQLLYFVSRFMTENQQFISGSSKKPQFEYELLNRHRMNVFLSIPMIENIDVTSDADGISLDPVAPPDLPDPTTPILVTAVSQRTPGGAP